MEELIKKYEELIDWLSMRINDVESYVDYKQLISEIDDIKIKMYNQSQEPKIDKNMIIQRDPIVVHHI